MLPVTLRRSIATAGLILGLVAVPVAAPHAGAQAPPVQRSCGSAGPPLCDVFDQLEVALVPLKPLFDLGIPVMTELDAAVRQLQSTIEQVIGDPEAVDLQEAMAQLRGVLDLVGSVTGPLLAPLGAAGLDPLGLVLTQLEAVLQSELDGAPGAAAVASASAPQAVQGSIVVPSAVVAPRPARNVASRAVPAVPEGAPLELPDLALPDVGAPVADAADLGALLAGAQPDLPTPAAPPLGAAGDAAAAAALALGGVVVTAGLLTARTRSRRSLLVD